MEVAEVVQARMLSLVTNRAVLEIAQGSGVKAVDDSARAMNLVKDVSVSGLAED